MKLSEKYKEKLISEIKFCRNKMMEEKDPRMKIFYYSGIYAVIVRIFNFEHDPHLQFIHFILNTTYNTINNRLDKVLSGKSRIPMKEDFFEILANLVERLENKIRADEVTYDILEKIVNLSYLTTGNGYYLSQKGIPVFSEAS